MKAIETHRRCVRAGACRPAAHRSEEAQAPDVYARPETDANLAEELPSDGDRDGIDGPILAAVVELAGRRVCPSGSGESAAYQMKRRVPVI